MMVNDAFMRIARKPKAIDITGERFGRLVAIRRAVQGGAMIHMGVCNRDKTLCVDCDDEDCVLAGDIESDCPAWVCQQPEKECKDCELLKEYVDKWRREHDTNH